MPIHVIRRKTKAGDVRYQVRCSVGGRRENGGRLIHLGSFGTRREAEACRQWASMELAAGRIPDRRRALIDELAARQTLRDAADAWIASRLDLAASTIHTYTSHVHESVGARLPLWNLHVRAITMSDVQAFVQGLVDAGVAPATTRRYVSVVKQTLDHADVSPNPARDPRLRLPTISREQPDPPSTREVVLILENVSKRHRLVVALLEATGLRVSELLGLTWGDVDFGFGLAGEVGPVPDGPPSPLADQASLHAARTAYMGPQAGAALQSGRFRIARGKTAKARRFVPVPVELCERVAALCPLEDRRAERRVFGGLSRETVTNAMARACRNAGIPLYSPHDLRHRHISRRVLLGEPITVIQQEVGHARASMTLDVYASVLSDTVEAWREADLS